MEQSGYNSHAWDPAELIWDPLALCVAERVHTEPPAASHDRVHTQPFAATHASGSGSGSANRLSDGDADHLSTSGGEAREVWCQVRARRVCCPGQMKARAAT